MSAFAELLAGDVIMILIILVLIGMPVIKIWEKLKITRALRSAAVLLDWRPSRKVWRKALAGRHDLLFSIVLGYILAVLALSAAIGLSLLEDGALTGGNLARFFVRAAVLLLCAGILWWQFRPLRWHFPYRYVFTEKGVWVIGEGSHHHTGFLQWINFDQVVQRGDNLVELTTPDETRAFDIVYPQELKEKVGKVISDKVPYGWRKAA
ncbi:MAG: hypothetical protein K6T66_02125 [Peptococcaceae bacterium]|nr:hypothetical protein [Peptococcaceae bacterium]